MPYSCFDVQTRRPETSQDVPFATSAQKAAEVFSMTIDARPKQYGETTYENVKRIFQRVQESEYLDKIYVIEEPQQDHINIVDEEPDRENSEVIKDSIITNENDLENLDDQIDNNPIESQSVVAVKESTDNCLIPHQQPQLSQHTSQVIEHVDVQHVSINNIPQPGQPMIGAPMAPPAASVPTFQGNTAHSEATTPVHVAMYAHPGMQTSNHQIQQMPAGGTIIASVPQPQIISVPTQQALPAAVAGAQPPQQRQVLGSPSSAPQTVAHQNIPIHNTAQSQPLTQAVPPQAIPIHNSAQNQPLPPGHYNYIQQMRPLAEVIGGGNFYFLQDSELDSPELNVQGQNAMQNTPIFDQQQSQPVIQQLQKSGTTILNEQNTTSLNQNQIQQVVSSQQQLQQQHGAPQQPIQTQTFTNQSFPQMQNSNNLNNSTNPLFQQQQLFNVPIQQQHGLQNSQQPQLMPETQQPMMLINRLGTSQQSPLIQQQQQQQQSLGQQQNIMQEMPPQVANQQSQNDVGKSVVYPFENPVVGLNYEQQMQNSTNALKNTLSLGTDEGKGNQNDLFNEFAGDANIKGSSVVSTPTPPTSDLTQESNKWNSDVNSNSAINAQQNSRKNEWTSSSNANSAGTDSGYDRNVNNESNHWNSSQETGGYRGPGNRNTTGYQRRDDRRVGGNGGGNYRGRSNYGSGGANTQQNGTSRGGGNNANSGIYFRNNENSNSGSYYPNSNGSAVYSNKDNAPRYDSGNGGNYRPRGNNSSNGRSNGPPPRNIGSRGGNSGSSNSNSYINSRQSSNRLPLGLENKN